MKSGLVALLWLGVSSCACAADFSFGRPVRLTLTFDSAASVAIGDVDGDGRDDLVATEVLMEGRHELLFFRQADDGRLQPPVKLELPYGPNAFFAPASVVDLDGDGRGEIAVGGGSGGVQVVRRDAAGGLVASTHPSRYECKYMDTGDIDGDGNIDIACHDWKETATLFHGNGTGGFRSPRELRTPMGSYTYLGWKQLRVADVTGDGRPDLLVTAAEITSFAVFANNGLGGFWPARVYAHPRSSARVWSPSLEVLDLDGDGSMEVVTASPETGAGANLNIYRRQENGFLALDRRIRVYDSPTALKAADVDRDGDAELLAGHFSFNTVTLFGAGAQGLEPQIRFDVPGFGNDIPTDRRHGHSGSLALGDLDHDGCTDLAAATHSGVQVLRGCQAFAPAVPVSDYDGDGVSDLMFRTPYGENLLWQWADLRAWLLCTDATGYFMCPRAQTNEWLPQASGDFDGDGNTDLFWRNTTTGAGQVWDRGFHRRDITGVASQDWQVLGSGDFDGDDRSDLFWRNSRTGANVIWKSADSSSPQPVAAVRDMRWKLAGIGDFDGDRRADLLWRHATTGRNVAWRGGDSAAQKGVATVSNLAWIVAGIGDIDGDGRDDLVWRNTTTGANVAWMSTDSTASVTLATVRDLGWRIAAMGDYNGDGEADLAWRHADGRNTIWRSADVRQVQHVESVEVAEVVR